jgi:hypothetical protein
MYCTVWIALTDASPSSSCLYVIPKGLDGGYHLEGDALDQLNDLATFGNIRAAPVDAGGGCVFSHRLVHWGSRPTSGAAPRLAVSYALTDDAFETGEFFDHAMYMPFPPLALRTALRAGQAILYTAQAPHVKGALGLNTRLWRAGAHLFGPAYREKVNSAAQWERFCESRK